MEQLEFHIHRFSTVHKDERGLSLSMLALSLEFLKIDKLVTADPTTHTKR